MLCNVLQQYPDQGLDTHQHHNNKDLKERKINECHQLYMCVFNKPCGCGNPPFGHPNGHPSRSRRVYSCSIPNHGCSPAAACMASSHRSRLFEAKK
jgi:hypothetical protein